MTDDPNMTQFTIENYAETPPQQALHECPVCGFQDPDTAVIEDCHPRARLTEERKTGVSESPTSHTGFGYPARLHSRTDTFCTAVETALQEQGQADPLEVASGVIADQAPERPVDPPAFWEFMNLVYLQERWLLPGYPESVPTANTAPMSLQSFCSQNDRFDGRVTDEMIERSPLITTERIYRANVYRTTAQFRNTAPHLPDGTPWDWDASDPEDPATGHHVAIFDDGTAHNAMVITARNWLATHSAIDWVTAPHEMGADRSPNDESAGTFGARQTPPPSTRYAVIDFAGFTDDPEPKLRAGGFVIYDDSPEAIRAAIDRMNQTDAATLLIFPTRDDIVQFIAYADTHEWFTTDPSPTDDVAEHYRRRPSISAINEEFSRQALDGDTIKFLTRKQLIDDVIAPDQVLTALTGTTEV